MWLNVILAFGTVLASVVAYIAWRESHNDRGKQQFQEQIKTSVQPLESHIALLEQKFLDAMTHNQALMQATVDSGMQPLREDIAVLKKQVELFWKDAAFDAAKILHQPDPARAHIDKLLEAFMEDTLTEEEEVQLRKYLVTIRNWEPGQDVGFPVHQGEQTAAAILLRTMEHAMTRRIRS